MKAIDSRLRKLERERATGECSCANPCRVIYPAGYMLAGGLVPDDAGPVICPTCGGERVTVEVAYTTFAYHGERERLQVDDSTGRVVFSWAAAVAAICPDVENVGL